MGERTYNVLFLCTGNSARSIIAESLVNHWGKGRFKGYSAGSFPKSSPNPYALELLETLGFPTAGLRSKSWDEFSGAQAPAMHAVITVCDSAAAEQCPYWPGSPAKVHWGYPDPSNAPEGQKLPAFELTRQALGYRMLQLLQLPLATLDAAALQQALLRISRA